ncbi:MAG: hypothetical protein V3U21_01095 [Thermodesulfobacteriota bacterium]
MDAKSLTEETMTKARDLEPEELNKFFNTITCTAIACMRGIHGDQFVTDFLTAALADKENMAIIKKSH